ncbi:MAG: SUMF1/EgtB/PvdO family nonheme iron enzyme [Bacteroidota bacterium]
MHTRTSVLFLLLLVGIFSTAHAQEGLKAPVVRIQSGEDYLMETGAGVLAGSQSNELYILTAAHVIPDPANIKVQFNDEKQMKANLVESNTGLDIAVITCRIPVNFQAPSSFALSKADKQVLQSVIVIGHPQGNDWDINFNTNLKSLEHDLDDRLFTLAPIGIGPGNSGGPVLNQAYELMGLVQEIDPVKAVCVDIETLLKACTAWKVPTNLLVGVTLQQEEAEVSGEEVRLQLILQEANTAFSAKKWRQAKRAYAEANSLKPSSQYTRKIQHCELEIAKDEAYAKYLKQGKTAPDLQTAYNHYLRAQENRDTQEIRELAQKTKERLAVFDINASNNSRGGPLPETFSDPLAGEFALIRGGTFTMGCDTCDADNWPAHQVYVDDFYMAKEEVSTELYCQFLNEKYNTESTDSWCFTSEKKGRQFVHKVSEKCKGKPFLWEEDNYLEIQRFVWWLSERTGHVFRVPTEAEWEYAALENERSPNLNLHNIIETSGHDRKAEVCSDYYHPNSFEVYKSRGTVSNPKGPLNGRERVIRGIEKVKSRVYESYIIERFQLRLVKIPHGIHSGKPVPASLFEDKMVLVEGGSFQMGASSGEEDNQPAHEVRLDDFYISRTELNIEEWEMIMGGSAWGSEPVKDTWKEVQQFIDTLNLLTGMNYRLPTEAEWEYAARGGKMANGLEKELIANKKSNLLGLFDMGGSVSEWCSDWYSQTFYQYSPVDNPIGPLIGEYRVVRDGKPVYSRESKLPNHSFSDSGFRLARSTGENQNKPRIEDEFEKNMIRVPGATFNMEVKDRYGDTSYESSTVSDFYLSKFEVTQEEWKQITGYNHSENQDCPTCPVTNVDYKEILRFIEFLNQETGKTYRLPTEAEWAFAASGGNSQQPPSFSGTNKTRFLDKYANFCYTYYRRDFRKDGFDGLAPVGSFQPNTLGFYDMSGNVAELCVSYETAYGESKYVPYARGGSFRSMDKAIFERASLNESRPEYKPSEIGFRLAADIE